MAILCCRHAVAGAPSPPLGILPRSSSDRRMKNFSLVSVLAFAALAACGDDGASGGSEVAEQAPVLEVM